jgi:hypothetical protein
MHSETSHKRLLCATCDVTRSGGPFETVDEKDLTPSGTRWLVLEGYDRGVAIDPIGRANARETALVYMSGPEIARNCE